MPGKRRIRAWMLAYGCGLTLLVALVAVGDSHKNEHHHSAAYGAFSTASIVLLLIGTFFYSFNYVAPLLRKVWKVAFAIAVIGFLMGLFVALFIDHRDPSSGAILLWLSAITMVLIFFPSFRAVFLLGYGNVDLPETYDMEPAVDEDPMHSLVRELSKLRRSTQTAWIVAIVLIALLALNSYFQFHFEPTNDSWSRVRRLAAGGKMDEALAVAHRLAEKQPDSPDIQVSVGDLELNLGLLHEAEESYARAFKLNPNEVTVSRLNAVRIRIDAADSIPTASPTLEPSSTP